MKKYENLKMTFSKNTLKCQWGPDQKFWCVEVFVSKLCQKTFRGRVRKQDFVYILYFWRAENEFETPPQYFCSKN